MARGMNIGEAARAAGVSSKMIRHYEQIGLVTAAARTDSGYRQYGDDDVAVLRFIRQARNLGFAIPRIAGLLGLWSDPSRASREVKALAGQHLTDLDEKMRQMAEMRTTLERLVSACGGGDDPHCTILHALAGPRDLTPHPGRIGDPPLRKAPARAPNRVAGEVSASNAHVDLMAWTRQARAHGDR